MVPSRPGLRSSSLAESHCGASRSPPMRHDARIVTGIQAKPFVTFRLQGYSRPGIWDCPITRQPRRALGLG
jgi:hypothetical protein